MQLTESHLRKHGWFLSITLDRSLPIGLDYSLLLSLKAVNNTIVTKINTTIDDIYVLFSLVESEGGCHVEESLHLTRACSPLTFTQPTKKKQKAQDMEVGR